MTPPRITLSHARFVAGGGVFVLATLIFGLIAWNPALADNDLFKMLAQAVIVQGLVGLVMAFLYAGNQHKTDEE